MNKGIWEVGAAKICTRCHVDMAPDYVMRCMSGPKKGSCERCGKEAPVMFFLYTMNKRGLEKIGRLEK